MQPIFSTAAAVLAIATPGLAQSNSLRPYATERSLERAVHATAVAGSGMQRVHEELVSSPGAPSLRIFFDHVTLGPNDYLDVTSLYDGATHRLTKSELIKWQNSSGYFNGDELLLELWSAPGSTVGYQTSHLLVGLAGGSPGGGLATLCGPDDRVASNDNRSLRTLNSSGGSACSGWLAGPDDCLFSAGHCFPTFANVAEANVPPSTSGGSFQHPPIEDQFPFDPTTLDWQGGGLGNDWAVARLLPNNLGESAAGKYGFHELGFFFASSGDSIRITGHGSDTGVDNQVNQTSNGPLTSNFGTSVRYSVDTTGGNSGSVVIHEPSGTAIAIHTNGGCNSGGGGANSGTSLLNTNLMAAWAALCDTTPPAAPTASFTASLVDPIQFADVRFTDTSGGPANDWAWDFESDGIIDSTAKFPTWAYSEPGTYSVTLTVTNALGTDTITLDDFVTVSPATLLALPVAQDFGAGLPANASWIFQSSNSAGVIASTVPSIPSPGSGGPALALAGSPSGIPVTNEAVLLVEADDFIAATLTYWVKSESDENDSEDGLFLSDGENEVLAVSHQNLPTDWTQRSVEFIEIAQQAGLDTSRLQIIFRQRDDFELGTDGHLIDDISLAPSAILESPALVVSASAGGTAPFTLDAGPAFAGQPYLLLGTTSGTTPGFSLGALTLPLNLDFYLLFSASHPNAAPLINTAGTLDGLGRAAASFTLAPGNSSLAGIQLHHAFLAGDLSLQGTLAVSNAIPLLLFF